MTRGEWLACVKAGGCSHVPDPRIMALRGYYYADDPRDPVMDVSYLDIQEYGVSVIRGWFRPFCGDAEFYDRV